MSDNPNPPATRADIQHLETLLTEIGDKWTQKLTRRTIDDRIDKLEFILGGHIEQAKKDYEENRRFVRESREDWQRQLKESREQWEQQLKDSKAEWDRELAAMRTEMAARDSITDKRIGDLVVNIGALIRELKPPR